LRHREKFSESIYADRSLFILASINFKRKNYRKAILFWQELVDSLSHSIYTAAALKEIGNSYFSLGDYGSALNAYNRVARYKPSEDIISEVSLKIYETKYYLNKFPSLVDALRRYVKENPSSRLVPKTKLRISRILYDNGQYYQSMSELDRIIEDNPDNMIVVEALILRVQVSQAAGDRFELVRSLQALLMGEEATEYRLYAANELGALWIEEARYDSALYYYNLLLDSETYRENAIVRIANIYNQLGQFKESIAMIERLISEYPKSRYLVDAYILNARALKNQGDYESAITVLREVTDKIGDRAELNMEIGTLYFESEEFAIARQYFLKACELFKQQRENAAQALLLAGDASVRIGEKTKGKEYYLQANMVAESAALKNQAMQKITMLDEE
jgi:tetratricopeptide (TPR) repeat protein